MSDVGFVSLLLFFVQLQRNARGVASAILSASGYCKFSVRTRRGNLTALHLSDSYPWRYRANFRRRSGRRCMIHSPRKRYVASNLPLLCEAHLFRLIEIDEFFFRKNPNRPAIFKQSPSDGPFNVRGIQKDAPDFGSVLPILSNCFMLAKRIFYAICVRSILLPPL